MSKRPRRPYRPWSNNAWASFRAGWYRHENYGSYVPTKPTGWTPHDSGVYWVKGKGDSFHVCHPKVPGCASGKTLEEAIASFKTYIVRHVSAQL